MKKVWKVKEPSLLAPRLAQESGLSLLEAELLLQRGINDPASAQAFLTPRLSSLMDPMLLIDMKEAVQEILSAIHARRPITIYGDYDADGLTATALLLNFLSHLDIPAAYYVPGRLREGYGLNPDAISEIGKKGAAGLIITVDCGTSNLREVALAKDLGMKVVVTDHHQIPDGFSPICPVVNPHRPESSFPFREISGVGLSFFLAVALRAALRKEGWFNGRPEPDLRGCLDLVALGTLADMVPLLDQNRIVVSAGLRRMRQLPGAWVRALAESASIGTEAITPQDIAFRLAPRLNACGRVGDAQLGLRLLTTQDPFTAQEAAKELNRLNHERQDIERMILAEIESSLPPPDDIGNRRTILVSGKGWHKGVLGIIAARLAERYHRPALVLTIEDGVAAGSGRSIRSFDLYQALSRLKHLFVRFGGHSHAAGFALHPSGIEALSAGLEGLAQQELTEEDLRPALEVDARLDLSGLDLDLVRKIRAFGPFGSGNPEPLFYAGSVQVLESRIVGERHLRIKAGQKGSVLDAVGFGLGHMHPLEGKTVHMVYTPEIDEWQGSHKVQIRIVDLEKK